MRGLPVRRLVLLDRDGTINVERNYLSSPDELILLDGAVEGIRLLNQLELKVAVVTNQSAIGRGFFDENRLMLIHEALRGMLAAGGAEIDAIYFCPHHPDDLCHCRKPAPGMAIQAGRDLNADLGNSFVVGDKICDIQLAANIGSTSILVETGYGKELRNDPALPADYTVPDLWYAAKLIEDLIR